MAKDAKAAKGAGKAPAKKTTTKKKTTKAEVANDTPQTPPADAKPDSANVPFMPPNILLLAIIAGITLDWIFPLNFGHMWGGVGFILTLVSFGGVIWCKKIFEEAQTNLRPDMPTTTIITDGPFQYSRNPIYVCFLAGFAGVAMMADAPVMLLLLGPLWFILDRKVIALEEAYLERAFGDEYSDYKLSTNRWI